MSFSISLRRVAVIAVLAVGAGVCGAGVPSEAEGLWKAPKVKIVYSGNDIPDTAYLRDNIELMERLAPFDGVDIVVKAVGCDRPGCDEPIRYKIFQNWKWKKEWFNKDLENLRAAKFKKFTDNFIRLTTLPGGVSWFDDDAWSAVCNNYAVMAWLAKEGGLKGIHFDVENYTPNNGLSVFQYNPAEGRTFEEAFAKARERGRQFMRAIAAEYDNIVIFTVLGSLSVNFDSLGSSNPLAYLKGDCYGLVPAFFNGMYDALPPRAKIIDGHERSGYKASNVLDYCRIRTEYDMLSKRLLFPSNIAKFHSQSSLSIGTYIDGYVETSGTWVLTADNISRAQLFRRNLVLAVKYSDEYAWLWGEMGKWWPIEYSDYMKKAVEKRVGKGRPWEEIMPGVTDAISFAKDPLSFAETRLAEGRLQSVLNVDFEPASKPQESEAPASGDWVAPKGLAGMNTWQRALSKGSFAIDESAGFKSSRSLRLTSVRIGCALRGVPVKPDEVYLVRVAAKSAGAASPSLSLSWKNPENKWVNENDVLRVACEQDIGDGWRRASAVVNVPPGTGFMYLQCGMASPGGADDVCWFDDIEVHKVF